MLEIRASSSLRCGRQGDRQHVRMQSAARGITNEEEASLSVAMLEEGCVSGRWKEGDLKRGEGRGAMTV
jgi:hypothetical protein